MGEGASRLRTGLQAFKWEPAGGRGLGRGWKWGRRSRRGENGPGGGIPWRPRLGCGRRQDPGGRPPTAKAGTEAWEWGGLGARNQEAFRASKKRPSPPRAFWERLQKIYNRRVTPPCRVGYLSGDANDLLLSALLGCHQLMVVLLITHVYTVL